MRTLKLVLGYDGTGYCGWQIQPNGPTIQQALTDAIEKVTGSANPPHASGRTDSGVHALVQVAHLRTESNLAPEDLMRALNANLPDQIVVRQISEIDPSFDAMRDAKWKLYRYVFHDGPCRDPFVGRYCWKLHHRLDVDKMSQAAKLLEGQHDFRSFESEWPNQASSVRTVFHCRPRRLADFVYLDVQADGFLYNMVRAIAGTLYEVGRGKWPPRKVLEVLESKDRSGAGPTAPARGLFLVRVEY